MNSEKIINEILSLEKEHKGLISLREKDLSYFCKKYIDHLELKELEYNITKYAS